MGCKNGFYIASVFALVLVVSTIAKAAGPISIEVGIEKAYIPTGFDDNDNHVQVAITGTFPNTCYKVNSYKFDVVGETITIDQMAYSNPGICLMIIVPFTQIVDFGILAEGNYTLLDKFSGKKLGMLPVGKAKSDSPDDFLYAPVTDAYVQSENGKYFVAVSGSFTNTCMKMKEVKVRYATANEVLEVMPIAEHDTKTTNCEEKRVPYVVKTPIRDDLRGVWFLHVRSLDGQAVNRFAGFPDVRAPHLR